MSAQQDIRICEDAAALAQQTTDLFVRLAQESVATRGRFTVALAGGSTPKASYAMLASAAYRDRVPWQQTYFFWGLLGMGPDGHTASLFPGTSAVHESKRLVAAPWVEKFNTFRITLTPPVLCNAAYVVFAAGGADKTETLQHVLQGPYQPDLYPSQVVRPTQGTLLWLVDKAAARWLS